MESDLPGRAGRLADAEELVKHGAGGVGKGNTMQARRDRNLTESTPLIALNAWASSNRNSPQTGHMKHLFIVHCCKYTTFCFGNTLYYLTKPVLGL